MQYAELSELMYPKMGGARKSRRSRRNGVRIRHSIRTKRRGSKSALPKRNRTMRRSSKSRGRK
jgi:hypothetical protein